MKMIINFINSSCSSRAVYVGTDYSLAYVIASNARWLLESMQQRRKACPRIRHIRLRFRINYTSLCKIYSREYISSNQHSRRKMWEWVVYSLVYYLLLSILLVYCAIKYLLGRTIQIFFGSRSCGFGARAKMHYANHVCLLWERERV